MSGGYSCFVTKYNLYLINHIDRHSYVLVSQDKKEYTKKIIVEPIKWFSDALILKEMLKKQTGFVLVLKQNKSDLVFHPQN